MNSSSIEIDFGLRRAKGSAVQRQKDMYIFAGSELIEDEGSPACPDFSGNLL